MKTLNQIISENKLIAYSEAFEEIDDQSIILFHGSRSLFKKFNDSKLGENTADIAEWSNMGHWLADNIECAKAYLNYAKRIHHDNVGFVMAFIATLDNPFECREYELRQLVEDVGVENAKEMIISDGYDSIIITPENGNKEYCIFNADSLIPLAYGVA